MFIGCKLSNGLNIEGYIVNGNHPAHDEEYRERGIKRPMVGGYHITENFPDVVWDRWFSENQQNPIVVNKLVVGASTKEECEALCGQNVRVRSTGRQASAA